MRKKLENLDEVRDLFYGTFVRTGIKNGYKGIQKTVLLKDVKDKDGNFICDLER